MVLGHRSPGPEAVALTMWGNFVGETGSDERVVAAGAIAHRFARFSRARRHCRFPGLSDQPVGAVEGPKFRAWEESEKAAIGLGCLFAEVDLRAPV